MKILESKLTTVFASTLVAATAMAGGAGKHSFAVNGSYVEGCSCGKPCKCELTGVEMGCEGVGAFSFSGGSFDGKSIAGSRAAYATKPGEWVIIYIDAPASRRAAVEGLMRAALGPFGKIEAVKSAKISLGHNGDMDWAKIDGGKVMDFKSKAIMGGDNKTPLTYSNIHDPVHPTVMQGVTTSCSYVDGDRKIDLKDSNAFFNHSIKSKGKL